MIFIKHDKTGDHFIREDTVRKLIGDNRFYENMAQINMLAKFDHAIIECDDFRIEIRQGRRHYGKH